MATTTSRSTATIISIAIQTLAAATATILVVVIVPHSCRLEAAETSAVAMQATVLRNCRLAAEALVGMPGTVLRNFPRMQGAIGSTIHHIAVEPHIGTGQLRIVLVALRAVIHLPDARRVHDNRSGGKAAIWPAPALAEAPA